MFCVQRRCRQGTVVTVEARLHVQAGVVAVQDAHLGGVCTHRLGAFAAHSAASKEQLGREGTAASHQTSIGQ